MFLSFYSYELHSVCLTSLGILFVVMSIVYMYVVLRKTPPPLSAYKFHFLYLNGCYQVANTCLALFGPFDVTVQDEGLIILELHGVIQYLPLKSLYYLVGFFDDFSICSIISAVLLSFLLRYCQVCHPKSRYATTSAIRKRVEAALSTVIPFPLAVLFTVALFIHSENDVVNQASIHVKISNHLIVVMEAIGFAAVVATVLCLLFIITICWTLYWKMGHASKRTKEMQRMLTITLIVCGAIPLLFGVIPLFLGIYTVVLRVEGTITIFRIIFIIFMLQGILNIIAAMLLVKPYRAVLLTWLRIKKSQQTVTVACAGQRTS
uniref:G_PROTEIN_RECEP_F1_2 domain-containing protein n=1 Tax=Steinernema glaseri TaxID=37863 RepID=A0A1I7YEZ7_9BILA